MTGDGADVPMDDKKKNRSIEDCIIENVHECKNPVWQIVPYLCGQAPYCRNRTEQARVLRTARWPSLGRRYSKLYSRVLSGSWIHEIGCSTGKEKCWNKIFCRWNTGRTWNVFKVFRIWTARIFRGVNRDLIFKNRKDYKPTTLYLSQQVIS